MERSGGGLWHFRGKAIVEAVVLELLAHHGLSDSEAVVLTGGSAGVCPL